MKPKRKQKPNKSRPASKAQPKAKVKPKPKPIAKRRKPMADKHDSDLPKSDKKSGPGNTPGTPEKDPKNLPETAPVGESLDAKKNTPPPDQQPHGPGRIDNAAQDPDHPSNKTLAKDRDSMRPGAERDRIDGPVYSSDNLRTEQEKDAHGEGMGVGPAALAEDTTGPAETIQQQGIGPRTPYPTGNPPPPSEIITRGQGIKGVTDKTSMKPGESKGPAGQTPRPDDKNMAYRTNPPSHPTEHPHKDPTAPGRSDR